jgi:hypothetical protein
VDINNNTVPDGDINGDGFPDILVLTPNVAGDPFANRLRAFLGNAASPTAYTEAAVTVDYAGDTTAETEAKDYRSLQLASWDGNSRLDMAIANPVGDDILIFNNTSSGTNISFTLANRIDVTASPVSGVSPIQIIVKDTNGSGQADLVAITQGGATPILANPQFHAWTNSGGFAFTHQTNEDFTAVGGNRPVAMTDGADTTGTALTLRNGSFNAGSTRDFVVVDDQGNIFTLLNNGTGGFPTATLNLAGPTGNFRLTMQSIASGDFDQNGTADLVIVATQTDLSGGNVELWNGNGAGASRRPRRAAPASAASPSVSSTPTAVPTLRCSAPTTAAARATCASSSTCPARAMPAG